MAVILAAAGYAALSLLDLAPMSIPIFCAWLAALVVANGLLMGLLWRERARLGIAERLYALLWGVIALWYWFPAPSFYLLSMNLDGLQLRWVAFAYLWEVPVVGGAFVLAARWLFRPAMLTLQSPGQLADPVGLYHWTLRYPGVIAVLIVAFSILGYAIGTLQLRLFAFFPPIEQLKGLAHGLTTSVFVAVLLYLMLDALLRNVRSSIATELRQAAPAPRIIRQRVLGVSLAVSVGSLALVSLFVVQASQRITHDSVGERLHRTLKSFAGELSGTAGIPATLPALGATVPLFLVGADQGLEPRDFSPETRELVRTLDSGVVQDLRSELKTVAWTAAFGGKLVSVAPMADFYGPLGRALGYLAIAYLLVLALTVGVLTFTSHAITQALRTLASRVGAVEAGELADQPLLAYTGDEIDQLSQGFAHYARQSREAIRGLYRLALAARELPDPAAIAQVAVDQVCQLLSVDHAAVYWWDEEAGGLRPVADNDPRSTTPTRVFPPGQGTAGMAFQTRAPFVLDDYPNWEGATRLERGVRSAAGVPLLVGDQAVGALVVRTYDTRHFAPGEVALLTLFATGVAPTLEVTRLHSASERQRATLAALLQLVRQGATNLDPEQVVALTTQEACRLLQADYAAVGLYTDSTLTWHGVWGNRSDIWSESRHPAAGGTLTRAIAEGRTVIATRIGENPEFPPESVPTHRAEGGRTALSTPLVVAGEAIGALVIGWRSDIEPGREQVDLAEMLAHHAATIIDNAQAHAEARARADELAASQERLQELYEAVSCGVLVRDAAGGIVHANKAAEELFGVPFEAMRGRQREEPLWRLEREDGSELGPDEHPSAVAANAGQPVLGINFGVVRPDGERRWLQGNSIPIFAADGSLYQVVTSFIDVTARKAAEAALKTLNDELEDRVEERTAELAASNRELEAFSYSVSHDLRAPLRGIDGFSQALLEDYTDQLDDQGRQYLGRIRAATQRMDRLIEGVLRFSRLARVDVLSDPVDLSYIARAVAGQLRRIEPDRDVTFSIAEGLAVEGDPDLLRLVLQNLLENAWKFTRNQPAAMIELNALQQEGEQVYYVRDNGAGFDMAYADKLFLPFQRLHDVRDYAGDGIGLANVKRVIERHGGRIWAEGTVGQGATFYFTLKGSQPGG